MIELVLNKKGSDLNYPNQHRDFLTLINQYFCPISSELYTLQGDKSYSLANKANNNILDNAEEVQNNSTQNNNDLPMSSQLINSSLNGKRLINKEPTRLKLSDSQLQHPTLVKLTPFTKGFNLRLNGCKV